MFLTIEKLERRMRQLEPFRFTGMRPVTPMASMEGGKGADEVYVSAPEKVAGPPLELGGEFKGRDRYLWAEATVTLPKRREGCEVTGLFDFGKTGGGHNSGFESLLYIDGEPYQGVDTNHGDVLLEPFAGQEKRLTFLLWTGLEGGVPRREFCHRIREASVGYLHKATDELYYFAKAICKALKLLPDLAPEKHGLTAALDNAFKLINWDGDKFHATAAPALECLLEGLGKMEKHTGVDVSVVGHTHIDVAWLWRLKHTREKAIRSFSTVLRLMEEFDEYVFLQTQPQLYKYVKQDCPALYEKIKARVAGGRWEADGGMWVEADCNLSSGEALARQLKHGVGFFREEFGKDCEYLWLPDVFGYSWALPQLLKLANIKTFMTTKISWNQYNSIPHDLFFWRGIDGTELLTYFVNTPEIGRPADDRFSTYNGMLSPRSVLGSWQKFRDKNLSNETLISYGYGDGGGGVNRNMLKMRRAMDQLPGLPNVKPTRAGDFFRRLHQRVNETDQYVHVWDGELYLEYHRGTYTSQAANKKYNRSLENAIARSEWLNASAGLGDYPAKALYDAWECVLLHQFHDIIPGSSIREVYEDSGKAYAAAETQVQELDAKALAALTEPFDNRFVVYHFGSFARRELVFLPVGGDGIFSDEKGNALQAQKTGGGWLVPMDLPPLSLTEIAFTPGAAGPESSAFSVDMQNGRLETPLYSLAWDRDGRLTALVDKARGRQVLSGPANLLELYEDKPLQYDNWDIDIFHTQKRELLAASGAAQLVETGGERCVIRFRYAYNQSSVTQDMIAYKDCPRIDFKTRVDWHEKDRLLKAAFPVELRANKASYDIQFGHLERPAHWNTSWDWARFEVVGHKWADLSEADYGVSLLNDCKYGYSVKDSVLRLTLLKSTKYPDAEADMGGHEFTYALLPHGGTLAQGGTIEESIQLNLPAGVVPGKLKAPGKELLRVAGGVHVDAVKKCDREDCLVLRVHECKGARTVAGISSDYGIRAFAPCNLLEDEIGEKTAGNIIQAELRPFEIKSFKIWL